jgi:hypothetical protein
MMRFEEKLGKKWENEKIEKIISVRMGRIDRMGKLTGAS